MLFFPTSNHTIYQMKTGSMIFSLLQEVPRCGIHSIANNWGGPFHSFSNKICGNNSSLRILGSRTYGHQGGHRKKWTRRPITTDTNTDKECSSGSTKSTSTKHEILSETISTSSSVNVNKTQLGQFEEVQHCDIIQDIQEIAQNKDLASLVTVMVFDIETTGLSRDYHGIIEIALRDLRGGPNSTFQTFVNPQRGIPNSHIHGITTQMVNKPDIPRMRDLVPILFRYVQSREKPGGYVLWVAHNARCFDVPFIINEFRRCSTEIPSNWLFVDTLPLARQLMKSEGTKLSAASLAALSEFYGIEVDGTAHRAMVDVNTLSMVLPRLTFDLKLTLSGLVQKSFREIDIINSKNKKKKN